MSQDWVEEAINDMEEYFENASDDQIKEDLKEAGYDYYKNVNDPRINSGAFKKAHVDQPQPG